MKFKHNKKRNTAFLFECMIRELTKTVIQENLERKSVIVNIIKKHFSNNSILSKEMELYKTLNEKSDLDPTLAEKVLSEAKKSYQGLNKEAIFEAQSRLINDINKRLSKKVMSNFVPNYKDLATIYQIFNPDSLSIKARVLLEQDYIKNISFKKEQDNKMKPIDKLTLKTFINNFNDTYSDSLLSEQKELLSKFIVSYQDNGLQLKTHLNEELGRIKNKLKEVVVGSQLKDNKEMVKKTNRVLNMVESYRHRTIDQDMIEAILKVQKLVKEIEIDES